MSKINSNYRTTEPNYRNLILNNAVYVTYFLFCTAYIMIFVVIKRSLVTYMQPTAIDSPTITLRLASRLTEGMRRHQRNPQLDRSLVT